LDGLAVAGLDGTCREPFLGKPLVVEKSRLILCAAVAKDGDDRVPRTELASDSRGAGDVDAARAAEEQSLLIEEPVHVPNGFRILHVHGVIDRRAGEIRGHASSPDALGDRAAAGRLESAVADEFVEAAPGWIGEHAAHRLAARLEVLRNTCQRAARAHGGDERIDAPVRLLPDLGPGRLDVRAAVGRVVELVGPDRVAKRLSDALRDLLILVRVAVGNRGDLVHLGAEHLEKPVLLRGLVVRHHDDAAIAARVADVREPDAGVASGALDDDSARTQFPTPLGILDDGKRGAVLHRAARIHELGLAEDLAAGLLAQAPEPDERCPANRSCKSHLHVGATHGRKRPRPLGASGSAGPSAE